MAAGNIWERIRPSDLKEFMPLEHQQLNLHVLGALLRFRTIGKVNDSFIINALI